MKDLVIGIDSSTTGTKVIVFDRQGTILAEGRQPISLEMPRPAWHEQPAETWWSALCTATRQAMASLEKDLGPTYSQRLAGLCITIQRETFVPVDVNGRPLRPAIVWMDERARELLPGFEREFGGERFHQITGKPLSGNLSAPKIAWLRQNEPETFRAAARYLDVHAFLVARLTGICATGTGCADPMGLLDMRRQAWSAELLDWLGLRSDQLPELVPTGAPLGTVTPEAARLTGLPSGLPVIAGTGDGQAGGLGSRIVAPGLSSLNLGTAVVTGTFSATYHTGLAFRTMLAGIPGAYLLETVLLGGGYTIHWFMDRFITAYRGRQAELEAVAARVPAGASGLLLVPYWNSVLNPYWDASASGIVAGWRGIHGPEHLYRAILEGIAFELRLSTEGVAAATGQPVTSYIINGGGARSDLWCQIIADVTGRSGVRSTAREATALGAGILAAAGTGLYPDVSSAVAGMAHLEEQSLTPDPARHAFYSKVYEEVYRHLYPSLQAHLARLADLAL